MENTSDKILVVEKDEEIIGYKHLKINQFKLYIFYILVILTFGVLYLISRWFPVIHYLYLEEVEKFELADVIEF